MEYRFFKTNKELKSQAVETLSGSWKAATKVTLLYLFFFVLLGGFSALMFYASGVWFCVGSALVSAFLMYVLSYGWKKYCWTAAIGENANLSLLFSGFGKPLKNIVGLMFKKFFLLFFWLFVFIVPAFYKWFAYDMAPYIMMDHYKTVKNPITESIHILKLNVGRLIKFYFSFLGWACLALLSGGIGLIWLLPYFSVAKAHFYENLKTDY